MMKSDLSEAKINGLDASVDKNDPFVINVTYPKTFEDSYIRPVVRLEIGPLASWVPHEEHTIQPYAAEQFPDVFDEPSCRVTAIKAERSFWEKATILHQEAHRSTEKVTPLRYSRHYYDLYKMAISSVKESALSDLVLLNDVAEFKMNSTLAHGRGMCQQSQVHFVWSRMKKTSSDSKVTTQQCGK
jgi:hypothetical protein